jgi:hypothetical protein
MSSSGAGHGCDSPASMHVVTELSNSAKWCSRRCLRRHGLSRRRRCSHAGIEVCQPDGYHASGQGDRERLVWPCRAWLRGPFSGLLHDLLGREKRMENPFLLIAREAAEKKWCVRPYCTTCGAHEYRRALSELAGPLCDALCSVSADDLILVSGWDEALEVAIRDLPIGPQVDTVLRAWLPRVGSTPRFDDVVLFRIVRALPASSATRDAWIAAAVPGAVRNRDVSLVETLLLVLGPAANRFPDLVQVAAELSNNSEQMRRVLRNTIGPGPA